MYENLKVSNFETVTTLMTQHPGSLDQEGIWLYFDRTYNGRSEKVSKISFWIWKNWSQHLDIALPSYHGPRLLVDAPQLFPSSIHRSRSKQRTLLGRWWRLGWSWLVDKKAGRCTWGTSRPGGSAAPVVGTFGKVVAPWSEVEAFGKAAIGIEMKKLTSQDDLYNLDLGCPQGLLLAHP